METVIVIDNEENTKIKSFRSDYEGWKQKSGIFLIFTSSIPRFRSDYEGWKLPAIPKH